MSNQKQGNQFHMMTEKVHKLLNVCGKRYFSWRRWSIFTSFSNTKNYGSFGRNL